MIEKRAAVLHNPPVPATLATLLIKNLALVESLEWSPGTGFIAVTGETGAGKSVILGALKLLVGERADRTLLRAGADQCSVEGVFHIGDTTTLDARLADLGVDPCESGTLLLRRIFSASGTNRQFVNCSPTTLAVLKELGDDLLDLHGPHDHQSLFSQDRQLDVLDAFASNPGELAACREAHRETARLQAELDSLRESEGLAAREIDLLRHQSEEIAAARLDAAEEVPLIARHTRAANSRRLLELCAQISAALGDSDDSIPARLGALARPFRDLERLDPSMSEAAARHAALMEESASLGSELARFAESADTDPGQLATMEDRINLIESLKRKYGPTLDDVIEAGVRATEKLDRIANRNNEMVRLEKDLSSAHTALNAAAERLTKTRTTAAPRLAKTVRDHLCDLGFTKAGFDVTLPPHPAPRATGAETVEFLFAPNPGEPACPLRAIASSGEISRVMLALKTALADQDAIPLLVFDEIDANVGGEIAHAVGRKMAALGARHQVLCITHLPQVAAVASRQFVVRKAHLDDRTHSLLEEVSGDARTGEIARMLGGTSDTAFALARQMLGEPPAPSPRGRQRK